MGRFDLLTIGDSAVDIFTLPEKAEVHCQLHGKGKECELCLTTASKVPTKGFTLTFGGNAANAAVGASRLGLKTSIYTHLGKDPFGKEILENFKKEKVDTSLVKLDKDHATNVNIALSYGAERTILTSHQKREYELPAINAQWIYFSSLAPGHRVFHEPFAAYLRKNGFKVVFNPGSYQVKEGLETYQPLLMICEVLILNREEAGRILHVSAALGSERDLLTRLRALGPRIVVVTDGPAGSYAYDGANFLFQKASPLKAVERTGAGDAFASGLTVALILGEDLREALKWGTANAGAVTQKVGAQAGLLTRPELEKTVRSLSPYARSWVRQAHH